MILTLLILFGAVAGGAALFGAGSWVRRREIEDPGDDGGERPLHTVVENETGDVQHPRRPSDPPPPPE